MGNSILMRKNLPVLEFDIDRGYYKVLDSKNLPIRLKGAIVNVEGFAKQDADQALRSISFNRDAVVDYLASRVLDITRENAKKILEAYQLSQSQNPSDKARIALTYHAVSMGDSYWIQNQDQTYAWEGIDPRNNPLNTILTKIALHGRSITLRERADIPPLTPELNGKGSYAHAWVRGDDGENYFHKKSSRGGNETDIEISVSKILDCFNIPHVRYEKAEMLENIGDYAVSRCKNMATDRLDIVSAEDFYCYCNRNNLNFTEEVFAIDSDTMYKMCIVDFLISNPDWHLQNWGFFEDNEYGNILFCHPLYDHNNAFDESLMEDPDCGISRVFTEMSRKEAAVKAMEKVRLECISPVKKDMFVSSEAYNSFMERAAMLNLYRKITPGFFQRIFRPEIIYEPKALSENAKDE